MGVLHPEGIRWIEVSADYLGLEGYGVAIVYVDVTDYKAALSKAQQLQTKFYTLFEESLDAICLIDPESQQIVEFNSRAHEMLGYSREEYAQLRIEQIDTTEDKVQVTRRVEQLFEQQAVRFSTQHRCKDGSLKDVQVNLRLVQIDDAPIIHATFHDVTELEDAKRALQEASTRALSASRSKSEFLANMSHEIRTPLGGVIGLIELTLKTDLGTKQRDYLQKSLNSAHALLRILNDILDYSKIEAGKLELESRPFELAEVLRTVKDLFGYQAQRKGIAFSVVAPPSCRLIGDALRLTQVLSNLVGNAVKFTHQGAITLLAAITQQSEERLEIDFSVKDSGIGMNAATLNRLFGSFHQADSSITREYGGNGLGLAISRQLVELMGGSIRVSSTEGVGSTFTFTLSLEIDRSARIQKPSEPAPSNDFTAIAGAHILLVEDNLINQLVATEMLSDFNVEVAQNGAEAVEKASSAPFDLILMDLQMPVMDGFEASRRIRASGNTTPIVALSAAVMQEDIIRSEEAGMNAHLSKPIEPEQLAKTLLQFLPSKEPS
ncbi:MAG: response regulator [Campylobacterales bacterium]|nr:response regulator [Campylobacterales bacterium]